MLKQVATVAKRAIKKQVLANRKTIKPVLKNVMNKLNVPSPFKLEKLVKSDPVFRKKFFTTLGEELRKKGFNGDPETLGKIAYKNLIREIKAEVYRRSLMEGLIGAVPPEKADKVILRLQRLFDNVVDYFGMNPISFYEKYNKDQAFRALANKVLVKEIRSDPVLSKNPILTRENPETIMHSLAALKHSFMTKTDIVAYAGRKVPKALVTEGAKSAGVVFGTFGYYMSIIPSMVIFSAIPQLSSMTFILYYGIQQHSSLFAQLGSAVSKIGQKQEQQGNILMSYAALSELQKQRMQQHFYIPN